MLCCLDAEYWLEFKMEVMKITAHNSANVPERIGGYWYIGSQDEVMLVLGRTLIPILIVHR